MIVWGGYSSPEGYMNAGGRYDAAAEIWLPTALDGAPPPLGTHAAAWTGSEMVVWGGGSANGGLYCACPAGLLVYADADDDGYGDAAVSAPSCDGSIPVGHVAIAGDCDDDDATTHAVPDEVGGVRVSHADGLVTIDWTPLVSATTYDVVRGALDALPVGPGGGDEACLASEASLPPVIDTEPLAPGLGWWYLVRAGNTCGLGTYGVELRDLSPGVVRATSTCP
jgi:hypothetical protein